VIFAGKRQYIIELDQAVYTYSSGCLSRISAEEKPGGETWLLTDFTTDTSIPTSRVAIVDTKAKYAPTMINRQLQEEGEFTEPVSVIIHATKKAATERTEVFYTALPVTLLRQYRERIARRQNLQILFPLYGVLLHSIRQMAGRQPLALVFRHKNHADLLIANKTRVYYANRATLYDISAAEVEVQTLWGIVLNDIKTAEREQHISIEKCVICNWFDAPDKPDWSAEQDMAVETPTALVTIDNESRPCSFLPLLEGLTLRASISPALDTITSYCRRLLPMVQIIVLLVALGLLAGGRFLGTATTDLKQEIAADKQKLTKLTDFTLREAPAYRPALALLQRLDILRRSKSFKTVIGDLTTAASPHMTIDQVKVDVQHQLMKIEVHGIINIDFKTAYREYRDLQNRLKNNGYTIVDNTFTTEIDQAQFLLTCTSPMGGDK